MLEKDELKRRIESLPKEEQIVLSLFYVDGLDFKQIAHVLDCTVEEATDKVLWARSRLDWMA